MVKVLNRFHLLIKTQTLRTNLINDAKRSNSHFSGQYDFTVRNVEIRTLKNFYKDQPKGIKFNVEYCDTKDLIDNNNALTVLAMHGAPGTHNDFKPYLERLSKTFGIRFICPNLPDFTATDRHPMYLHKVEEKAIYLNDFLKHLNVENVDLLMTHSSGVYPSLYLWNNLREMPDNRLREIRSLALFSPPGYRAIKAMRPQWFTKFFGDLYCTTLGRKVLRATGAKMFKLAGVNMKLDNIDNLLLSCVTMNNAREELLKDHFDLIAQKQVPVFYTFSKDDRLIEKEIFYECLRCLDLEKKDLVLYDRQSEISQLGNLSKLNRAIAFERGGHYCFLKHKEIIANYLCDFIQETLFRTEQPFQDLISHDLNIARPQINLEQQEIRI